MIIDGRALAKEVLARTKTRALALGEAPRVSAIVANETPATKSYLSIKAKRAADAGCVLEVVRLPEGSSTAELRSAVLSADADAVIVQLPLPGGVDTQEVCDAIPLTKDADVLSTAARTLFERGYLRNTPMVPPVVAAVREIFEKCGVDPKGKQAAVLGDGWLVGNPCAVWLRQQGAAVVTLTKRSENIPAALRAADIIISGAGVPHLITPDMLKDGIVLIDAGTSESNGEVAGDADPVCAEKSSLFTPVPGGVGPLAVACLFENIITLAERATHL